jgi:hypothetical protein
MRCTSAGRAFLPDELLFRASACDDRALAVEDGDHPIRRNLLARQDLTEALREESPWQGRKPPARPAHGDVDGNQRPARDLAGEKIGDDSFPGFRRPGAPRQDCRGEGSALPNGTSVLMSCWPEASLRTKNVARQVAYRVLGLAVERGEITR